MSGPGTPGRSTERRRSAVEAAEGNRRELGAAQALEATGGPHCGPPRAARAPFPWTQARAPRRGAS
eukprot:15430647-Alexandrium_andersonii.AAC.1